MAIKSRDLGVSGLEMGLRLAAAAGSLAAAIVMGTNKQNRLGAEAKYYYSPAFTFFVVANAVACCYAVVSVPASWRLGTGVVKFMVAVLDLVMVALVMGSAAAATAIAYVGHKGNSHTGWIAICGVFGRFCDHVGGALVASFVALLLFMALVIKSLHTFRTRAANTSQLSESAQRQQNINAP